MVAVSRDALPWWEYCIHSSTLSPSPSDGDEQAKTNDQKKWHKRAVEQKHKNIHSC